MFANQNRTLLHRIFQLRRRPEQPAGGARGAERGPERRGQQDGVGGEDEGCEFRLHGRGPTVPVVLGPTGTQ